MDSSARLTSKGQVTIPKVVRDALELHKGDEIVFRVEHRRAIVAKTPDFIGMAGTRLLLRSLELYEIDRPDFAEAYLIASAEATGVEAVVSFDRAIDRVATVERIEP